MFYMNNSNLLIRITELSTEKVSNWIQATPLGLEQGGRHRHSSAHTHLAKIKVRDRTPKGQGVTPYLCKVWLSKGTGEVTRVWQAFVAVPLSLFSLKREKPIKQSVWITLFLISRLHTRLSLVVVKMTLSCPRRDDHA